MSEILETSHVLDTEGEICKECGLFEEFFEIIPDCPAMDDDADGDTEDEEETGEEGEEVES